MDFSIDTIKYNVRHLTAITPIFPGEGAIACLHEADTTHMLNGTLDYAYHVIYYRDTTQDTATDIAWCTKEGDTYIKVGTTDVSLVIEENVEITLLDGKKATIYKVLPEGARLLEFELHNTPKRIYAETALTAAEIDQLKALTNMDAAKLMEELLAKEYAKLATIKMTNGSSVLSLDDKGTATDANKFTVTYLDTTLRRKISDYNYEVKMLNADGTASSLPKVTLTAKTYDGCTAIVPTAYTNGFAKVRIYFTWHITGDPTNYRVFTDVTLTDWNDPVIMVDSLSTYDELSGYGMMISPAVADPTNFAGCKDLTDEQMTNGTAIKVLLNQNLITATAAKVAYFESFGYNTTDATEKAKTFMTLSEAKAVLQIMSSEAWSSSVYGYFSETTGVDLDDNPICYNARISTVVNGTSTAGITTAVDLDNSTLYTLTHFESFAYFINCNKTGVQQNRDYQTGAFENTKNLVTIYWPLGVNIDAACFRNSGIINLQTLLD